MKRALVFLCLLATAALIAAPAFADNASADVPWTTSISGYVQQGIEAFTYGNTRLVGGAVATPWQGTLNSLKFEVFSNELQLYKPGAAPQTSYLDITAYAPANGKLVVGAMIASGPITGGDFWEMQAYDTAGVFMAGFRGSYNSVRGQVGTATAGTYAYTTTNGVIAGYAPTYLIYDTATKNVDFWSNGSHFGSATNASSSGASLGTIKLNIMAAGNNQSIWMDNLTWGTVVPVPEPSSLLALGMFGVGALGFIKRRRA